MKRRIRFKRLSQIFLLALSVSSFSFSSDILATCECDANVNGQNGVDLMDQILLGDCINQGDTSGGCGNADVNCDGLVNMDDLDSFECMYNGGGTPGTPEACCDQCNTVTPEEDCDGNNRVDSCELAEQTAFDENGNGLLDRCEFLSAFADDDVCHGGTNSGNPCATQADCPDGACGLKSRYISIIPGAVAGRGVPLPDVSIEVTILDIDDALGLDALEGDVWWAGPPQALANAPNPDLTGAQLICEPTPSHAQQWPVDTLSLFGAPIVPGSTYEVRMCDPDGLACSAPLTIETGKWGDVVPGFGGSGQPNFADITSLVDKFKELASGPDVSRTDLVPEVPNQVTNFADISADVGAFKGSLYSNAIPACP